MTLIKVAYFASLREVSGTASEEVKTSATDLAGLYDELRARHGFRFGHAHLRVAVDDVFARWADRPRQGSLVAFIPPVSGG